jgi:pimeloyl-ACP methyl ester carboxylesterase
MAERWWSIERAGAEIWCLDSRTAGPPVVLLHGLAGYAEEWRATIDELSGRFRVIAVEQRGHGRSTRRPPDVSRTAYVDDVAAVIRRAAAGPVTLVGQSMGAHTAMLTAARYPALVERLVLVEGGVGGGGPELTEPVHRWLAGWPVPFASYDDAVTWFGDGPAASVWAAGLEVRADGLWPRFDADVLGAALAAIHEREYWDDWCSVAQRTLLVFGENGTVDAAQLRDRRPGTGFVAVGGAGHDVHLDRPAEWLQVLTSELDQ